MGLLTHRILGAAPKSPRYYLVKKTFISISLICFSRFMKIIFIDSFIVLTRLSPLRNDVLHRSPNDSSPNIAIGNGSASMILFVVACPLICAASSRISIRPGHDFQGQRDREYSANSTARRFAFLMLLRCAISPIRRPLYLRHVLFYRRRFRPIYISISPQRTTDVLHCLILIEARLFIGRLENCLSAPFASMSPWPRLAYFTSLSAHDVCMLSHYRRLHVCMKFTFG